MSEANKFKKLDVVDSWAELGWQEKGIGKKVRVVSGDLTIGPRTDLRRYQGLVCVRGNLIVDGIVASSVELPKLVTVEGNVVIQSNRCLTNFRGLERLTFIGGDLVVRYNDALVTFEGLEGLRRVGDLQVYGNGPVQNDHTLTSLIALAEYQVDEGEKSSSAVQVESEKHVRRAISDGTGTWELEDIENSR